MLLSHSFRTPAVAVGLVAAAVAAATAWAQPAGPANIFACDSLPRAGRCWEISSDALTFDESSYRGICTEMLNGRWARGRCPTENLLGRCVRRGLEVYFSYAAGQRPWTRDEAVDDCRERGRGHEWTEPGAVATPAAPAAAVRLRPLPVVPIQFVARPGPGAFTLDLSQDGTVRASGQPYGRVSDNHVSLPDGTDLAVSADGRVLRDGAATAMRFEPNGDLVALFGSRIRVRDDGSVVVSAATGESETIGRFTGLRPQARPTAALLFLAATFVSPPAGAR